VGRYGGLAHLKSRRSSREIGSVAEVWSVLRRHLKGLYVLDPIAFELAYGTKERETIAGLVDVAVSPLAPDAVVRHPELLENADVIFSGWGGPALDDSFLARAPRLQAFLYAGGALGSVLTPAAWERKLVISSAIAANARPVAEYTLATILFSLKHGWRLSQAVRQSRTFPAARDVAPGAHGSTIGLISLGWCARALLKLLKPFDLNVILYDPYVSHGEAESLGVELASLDELFRRCDVVSLHTPLLTETQGLVTGAHLGSMRPGATFINTARGEIVRQDELIGVAARRPDLQFVLDVTCPEPPEPTSPLYDLPNVVLTPHIAGSAGAECRRMGRFVVEELRRFIAGRPLEGAVSPAMAMYTSHRPVLFSQTKTRVVTGVGAAALAAAAGKDSTARVTSEW
jgi:phosphoglycerate dehydrogenase-like enzyme